jgi:hypothetical protein
MGTALAGKIAVVGKVELDEADSDSRKSFNLCFARGDG